MRLRGKVALLTGAAAALDGELMGFGGAVAHRFLREGAKIILTDIRKDSFMNNNKGRRLVVAKNK